MDGRSTVTLRTLSSRACRRAPAPRARAGSLQSWRSGVGIKLLLGDRYDPAVLAHLDHVEALRGILEHPVLALELGGDALDRALDPERLVAADAMEGLLLLEHSSARGRGAEIELRPQRNHLLRAGGLA